MSLFSPHYNLNIFGQGAIYDSAADRRRMEIIDNHLEFLSTRIGDGRIEGWELSIEKLISLQLVLSSGMGIINNFTVRSFSDLVFDVIDNRTTFVYVRRKQQVIGGFSDFSDLASILHIDEAAPETPLGFSIDDVGVNSLTFSWIDSSEDEPTGSISSASTVIDTTNLAVDFSHYIIHRSTDNITFSNFDESTVSSYTDINLIQNTIYYYRIIAVDLSGNQSTPSITLLVKTLKDIRQPINSPSLNSLPGNELMQLLWTRSPWEPNLIDRYEVHIQELDSAYEKVGDPDIVSVDPSETYTMIRGLKNNIPYRFTLYTVSINEVLSEPLDRVAIPVYNPNPQEVDSIAIGYTEGTTNNINAIMNLSWIPVNDPYIVFPTEFKITLVENGSKFGEPIDVIDKFERDIQLIPFKDDSGNLFYESLKEDTTYTVQIQTVDDKGNISSGFVAETIVPSFRPVPPLTDPVIVEQDDRSLAASWVNSTSLLRSHNLLSVTLTNLDSGDVTTVLDREDIGLSTSYLVTSSLWTENADYDFVVIAVDKFDNESLPLMFSFTTANVANIDRPAAPPQLETFSKNKRVDLQWQPVPDNNFIDGYRIYRAEYKIALLPSGFELVETITNAEIRTYSDYEVDNGRIYTYIISSFDAFGQESLNPIDDTDSFFNFVFGVPTKTPDFVTPSGLRIAAVGLHDALIQWDETAGSFDGFEIWRSNGNKFSFELIDSVSPDQTSFADEDVLLIDNTTYYYIVRTFRNEVEIFTSESSVIPQGSLFIGKITTDMGGISIDQSDVVDIKDLLDPITTIAKAKINDHKHTLGDIDRRINLDLDITVDDWETNDFQRYTTKTDIEGAESFKVKIIGTVNENFFKETDADGNEVVDTVGLENAKAGALEVHFEIVEVDGVLTFEFPLFSNFEPAPFLAAPTVTVTLENIAETQSQLPADNLESLSATQIASGTIAITQLPTFHHEGRIDEKLIPTSIATTTEDSITFSLADSNKSMGNAITFYDVLSFVNDDELIAASSAGILLSTDFGSTWESKFTTFTAPLKLFHSSSFGKYFAFTNKRAFATTNSATAWNEMAGLQNVKIIRDVIEDDVGNMFISTDLGVYKLDLSQVSNAFEWTQTPIFGPRSTESYALLYDNSNNRILVSNELGILESTNNGASWSFSDEFDESRKIFQFVQSESTIFAATKDEVWRKKGNEDFVKVADISANITRRMLMFEDRLYLSADTGLYATITENDILNDSLTFKRTLPEINIKNNAVPVYSLNVIDGLLFAGTDKRLFFHDTNKLILKFDQVVETVPSVYVDGVLQQIGFRYNNSNNNLSFDERLSFDAVVTVVNQYKNYKAENNGWSFQKYDSELEVEVNGLVKAKSDAIVLDSNSFSGFVFSTFSERNSYVSGAEKYKAEAEADIARVVGINDGSEDFALVEKRTLVDVVASAMDNIEKFLSQLFVEARVDGSGNPTEFPAINIELKKYNGELGGKFGTINASDGKVEFESPFSKFDILTLNVLGSTIKNIGESSHRETEDELELIDSGLPSILSRVKQVNLVKAGIFNEQTWPGEQDTLSTPVQVVYIAPTDNSFYDSLNSDIDFSLHTSQQDLNTTISYPSGLVYISDAGKVFVGGRGGLMSITVNDIEIDFVDIGVANPNIKTLIDRGGQFYAVEEKNVYLSEDNGVTWNKISRLGLPNTLFSMGIINNMLVVGGEDGIYFKSKIEETWTKAIFSTDPVTIIFDPDLVFALVDGDFYFSSNGSNFIKLGAITLDVNVFFKHRSVVYTGTNTGLYADNGSFYGGLPEFSLEDILSDTTDSALLKVNDMVSSSNSLIIGLSDGRDVKLDNSQFTVNSNSNLSAIHKVLNVDGDIWFFGYDRFKIPSVNKPFKLTTGAPL